MSILPQTISNYEKLINMSLQILISKLIMEFRVITNKHNYELQRTAYFINQPAALNGGA